MSSEYQIQLDNKQDILFIVDDQGTIDLNGLNLKDPIFIQKQKLNSILQERQNLINELQVLQNG